MDHLSKQIHQYCIDHSSPVDKLLEELERETHLKTLAPQMLSGPLQGKFLSTISKMMSPSKILEIGTFTGYATLCLAEGLSDVGSITTIEINPELSPISSKYFAQSSHKSKINALIGDANKMIPTLEGPFDLVFIDAGKMENDVYYEQVLPLLKSGGYILVDNVLWDHKVISNPEEKTTKYIVQFNKKILEDERVENVMLPLRDGLNLVRKR